MTKLFSFTSFRVALALVIVLLLEWFPQTGILLMFTGGPLLIGILLHLFAVALAFDIWTRTNNRFLLLVPVAPYLIYYAVYAAERFEIANVESMLRADNPAHLLDYDPALHALVTRANMTVYYRIPVQYARNNYTAEGFLASRIVTRPLCDSKEEFDEEADIFGATWSSYYAGGRPPLFKNLCILSMPEKPDKALIEVRRREETRPPHLKIYTSDFTLDGRPVGTFVQATFAALTLLPVPIVGCYLIDMPSEWSCTAHFYRDTIWLDTYPGTFEGEPRQFWPPAALLGIEKYAEAELRAFVDFDETVAALDARIEWRRANPPDEWGIRPGGPYQPEIGSRDGHASFIGYVDKGSRGGPFQTFIRAHEGEIVYLDIVVNPNINVGRRGFRNRAVCPSDKTCNPRTSNTYLFNHADGERHFFEEPGIIAGYFRIGEEETANGADQHTQTILTVIKSQATNLGGSS